MKTGYIKTIKRKCKWWEWKEDEYEFEEVKIVGETKLFESMSELRGFFIDYYLVETKEGLKEVRKSEVYNKLK